MHHRIPNWAKKVLRFIVGPENYEFLAGDIQELFNQRYREKGLAAAFFFLLIDMISEFRVKSGNIFRSQNGLLLNNLKVSVRNFSRHKAFAFTSLLILSTGMFSFFIILKFVDYESNFESHIESSDSVHRVYREVTNDAGTKSYCNVPAPLGPAIIENVPGIEKSARICKFREAGTYAVKSDLVFKEPNYLWAGKDFLDLMNCEMISGDRSALDNPGAVVLTESTAQKYFGEEDPMGKIITFRTLFYQDVPMQVTAIIKDPPASSHIHFDIINSFATLATEHFESIIKSWEINYYFVYIRRSRGADVTQIAEGIDLLVKPHLTEIEQSNTTYNLQPISDIYLNPNESGKELGPTSDKRYSYFISIIGFLILLMSAINYTNLATVRSMQKGKEIGVRKAIGASKRGIFWQQMIESQVLCLAASILAVALAYFTIPMVNSLFDRAIPVNAYDDYQLLLLMVAISLITGFASGFYPALVLGALRPSSVLKAGVIASTKNSGLRKSLVVVQFVASAFILFSATIVRQQMDFAMNSDLGFNTDHLLIMPLSTAETVEKFDLLKDLLEAEPEILQFGGASQYVGSPQLFGEEFEIQNPANGESIVIPSIRFESSYEFLDVLGTEFVAGRNFDPTRPADMNTVAVVNESFAREAGFSDAGGIIGKDINVSFGWGEQLTLKVVGVIKDFKMESVHLKVDPAVFYMRPNEVYFAHIRIDDADIPAALNKIETVTKSVAPEIPFNLFFQDESIGKLYNNDRQFQSALSFFTVLAILIACLGLFSFSLYMIRQKTKEIGIRKVLGASVMNIATRLLIRFLRLVIVSLLVSLPLAHLLTEDWLNGFSYRITPSIITYVVVGGTLILLTVGTVLYHTGKAASVNPARTLRSE